MILTGGGDRVRPAGVEVALAAAAQQAGGGGGDGGGCAAAAGQGGDGGGAGEGGGGCPPAGRVGERRRVRGQGNGHPSQHTLVHILKICSSRQCSGSGSTGSTCFLGIPDPDPFVRGMDPRIRIHTKMSWIRNTGSRQFFKPVVFIHHPAIN
jgi:hypothetical protein